MYIQGIILAAFSIVTLAQNQNPTGDPNQINNPLPRITEPQMTIATAQPAPDDIAASIVSEASIRASSISTAAESHIASLTNSIASEASQISSKLSSISGGIESETSVPSKPSRTASDNVAPIQTGVVTLGALFGAGVILANF